MEIGMGFVFELAIGLEIGEIASLALADLGYASP